MIAVGLLVALPAAAAGRYRAFDYRGRLPDGTTGAATITEVFGINDQSRLVGSYCAENDPNFSSTPGCNAAAGGSNPSHGYVADAPGNTSPHNFKRIDFILPSGKRAFETEAIGLNDEGQIIGLYDASKPTPGTESLDIGDGYLCRYPCQTRASFKSLSFPGATSTDGSAINDNGTSIGLYALKAKPPFKDFGWMRSAGGGWCKIDVGRMGVKGGIDTNALGLNNYNDVVGSYDDAKRGISGFRLTDVHVPPYKHGKPQTCTSESVWTFKFPVRSEVETEAFGINDDGTIVGNYLAKNGVAHAFRCQPEDPGGRCSRGEGFQAIDFPQPGGGDNAATSLNSLDSPVVVGNFEQTTSTPAKERAWIRSGW